MFSALNFLRLKRKEYIMNMNSVSVIALDGIKHKDFDPKVNKDDERIVCGNISEEILDEIDNQIAAGDYEQEALEL